MRGIGVSPGIAVGRAVIVRKSEPILTGILLEDNSAIPAEVEKFDAAVEVSVQQILSIKRTLETGAGTEGLDILETQIEFLTDPQIRSDVIKRITDDKRNVNDALIEVIRDAVQLFENLEDEYLRARAADLQDIGNRILRNLNNTLTSVHLKFESNTILIAEDITPSDTLAMDITNVAGFVTATGGRASHAAIIAKSRGIPAVAGCGSDLNTVFNDDLIILDGIEGVVIVNPDPQTINEYVIKKEEFLGKMEHLKKLKDLPSITTDGKYIMLTANISGGDDMEAVFEQGGEGVGLFRTELLFMGRDTFPTENEQFEFYKNVALKSKQKPVIVRTLDIGGDKQLPYFGLPAEQNPFLGYRAIRICLDRKDLFITQLKAILRASLLGNLKIMFPMISSVEEIRAAKQLLDQARAELQRTGTGFNEQIEIGIMIEIPSAALMADILAKEVDFFSIGTNDLCQYTVAVDRMNEKVKNLYDPFNPGLLRLISHVIDQAHKHHIHVGLCGEMASDPMATLLLAGMGLEEFSMSAVSIPLVKSIITSNSISTARIIYEKVMEMDNSRDIKAYLQEVLQ